MGAVVGHEVIAGREPVLYHGAALGHDDRGQNQPHIGHGVEDPQESVGDRRQTSLCWRCLCASRLVDPEYSEI